MANSEPRSGRDAGALPNLERCGSKFLEHRSFEEVTLVVEGVVGCGVDGEETLRGAGCGLSYVKGLPEDQRDHRSFHRIVVETFEPKPTATLAKLHAEYGEFVPVRFHSPQWMHKRLYRIAQMLQRENGYDFVMWDMRRDDGDGYIFTDAAGRALGGFAVRWCEWTDWPDSWVLQWIWVAPPHRRQGLMRRAWAMLTANYPDILPERPFSRSAAKFFKQCDGLPDFMRAWIDNALTDQRSGKQRVLQRKT